MSRKHRHHRKHRSAPARTAATRVGLIPGAFVYSGDASDSPIRVRVLNYGPESLKEQDGVTPEQCVAFRDAHETITWLDVDGIHNAPIVQQICEAFRVHPLAIEDALTVTTMPKADDYGDILFVSAKAVIETPQMDEDTGELVPMLEVRQVSLVAGSGWVISFREGDCQCFDGIEKRIRSRAGRIRRMHSDYLLHALLDSLVDHYYVVLARIEEQVEQIEENTLAGEVRDAPQVIHRLKSELMSFRRIVFPTREAIGALLKGESELLTDAAEPYFRDLYDHIIHVMEIVDGCRDRLLGMLDLHVAVTTQRTNDVMRLLTIVATIFIPLTFLASIYGMNFTNMPETRTSSGYFVLLGVMAVLAALMVGWFRKKDWL